MSDVEVIDPTFGQFCKELSQFYVNDELKPALHFSFLNFAETGAGLPDAWYLAVHRYPNGPMHESPEERAVVCTATRASFGLALFELYSSWLRVRNLDSSNEAQAWALLRDAARRSPPQRRRRPRR